MATPSRIQGRTRATDCLKRAAGWRKACTGYTGNPADWCPNCLKRTATGQRFLLKQQAVHSKPERLKTFESRQRPGTNPSAARSKP